MNSSLIEKDYKEIQQMIQVFARKEVEPLAAKRDEDEYFDWNLFNKMATNGLMGIPWPEEYGGSGMDYPAFVNGIRELSKVCAATGSDVAIHTALGSWPIYTFGTEEQKQKYLRPLAEGKQLGAFSLTEPNHGSGYETLDLRAVKKGDHYILNGNKAFTSNAGPAGIYIVFASTDPSPEASDQKLSAFIVEKGIDGFFIGKPEKKMGIRGHVVASLSFENCLIPKENLLGEEGQGHMIAKQTLQGGRLTMSAQALGIAEGAYQHALEYVKERKQFGKRLMDFQTMQFRLAETAIQLETSRLLIDHATQLWQSGMDYNVASSMAKAYVSEMAMKVTTDVVQIFGGYGYTRDYPVERMMRDAKITQIYTGTVEMQKIAIAEHILG